MRHPDVHPPCENDHAPRPESCRLCHLAEHSERHMESWRAPVWKNPPPKRPKQQDRWRLLATADPDGPGRRPHAPRPEELPCATLGRLLTTPERVATGKGHSVKAWRFCLNPSLPLGNPVCRCEGCGPKCVGYRTPPIPTGPPAPSSVTKVGVPPLVGNVGEYMNASLLRHQGRWILAYRTLWAGSQIHVVSLDEGFQPVGDVVTLRGLYHPGADYGREDPRLFLFQGNLHVSYTGVTVRRRRVVTNQLYARLSGDFKVERVFFPSYARRNHMEKNWTFFEYAKSLYAVYSIFPHTVLRIEGDHVAEVHITDNAIIPLKERVVDRYYDPLSRLLRMFK